MGYISSMKEDIPPLLDISVKAINADGNPTWVRVMAPSQAEAEDYVRDTAPEGWFVIPEVLNKLEPDIRLVKE